MDVSFVVRDLVATKKAITIATYFHRRESTNLSASSQQCINLKQPPLDTTVILKNYSTQRGHLEQMLSA